MIIILLILAIILAAVVVISFFRMYAPAFGGKSAGDGLRRIQNSPNFNGKIFVNQLPTPIMVPGRTPFGLMKELFKRGRERVPKSEVPFLKQELRIPNFDVEDSSNADISLPKLTKEGDILSVRWFGHSTNLIEIGGLRILTDPVFSKRASPLPYMGPKAFPGSLPYEVEELPDIDIILLSHDHYDHLDYPTIRKIHQRTGRFLVPLGVGAHLLKWGVPAEKINEFDWWEEVSVPLTRGRDLNLTSAPQRHFSGRGTFNRNTTLWCSWIIRTPEHSIFFGGDGGFSPVFREIGQRFGPFEVSLLECGAYSPNWPNIHSLPEQTV